jgi:uncharacterized metal-binding protein
MVGDNRLLIFLCSGAAKAGNKKLSFRIATQLEALGVAHIGSLRHLSEQHTSAGSQQRNMIFINDCRSACVNVFTHGFNKEKYIYFDVSSYLTSPEFDVLAYIQNEVLPKLRGKWSL